MMTAFLFTLWLLTIAGAIGGAVYLMAVGADGWGWLIFLAFVMICSTRAST